jgi:small-conductance mechanosensitive channel
MDMNRRRVLVLLSLVAALAGGARMDAQAPPPAASASEADVPTSPVQLDGATLFRVRGVSAYPAEVRAAAVQARIEAAAADPAIAPESMQIVTVGDSLRIVANGQVLAGVVDADAALEGISKTELAAIHLERIRRAIADYRAARSAPALRRAAISTLVATVILAVLVFALLSFWRWFDAMLKRRVAARIRTVGIQSFEVMRAEQIRGLLQTLLLAFRALVLLTLVLIYFGLVLAEWPWTRGVSHDVAGFALGPLRTIGNGIVTNVPRLVFLAVLFVIVRVGLRLVKLFFESVGSGTVTLANFDPDWAQPTYKLVRVGIVAFALVVAYPYIPGSQSDAFKGVSLFIGIVFSLGSSTAISNTIAGYMMTYRRAFKVGDRVQIGDTMGDVIEMRLQVTHLRTFKNEEVIIPNSQILSAAVVNYGSLIRDRGLILHTEVGIGYETPWRQVEAMLLEAAGRVQGQPAEARPYVLIKKLADFAVTYELNLFCPDVKAMLPMYTAMHRNILDVFNQYGIQIMTPAYEGDPAEPKIVPPKDWYTAPAVRPQGEGV